MATREQLARVLHDLPSGTVRWASAPAEKLPRLASGVPALDALLGGGWPRGRICSVRPGSACSLGRTSLAVLTIASASRQGLLCAWIDSGTSLDPVSLQAAGSDMERVLWVQGPPVFGKVLSAGEEVLKAGGFEVVVIRVPGRRRFRYRGSARGEARTAAWIRLSRSVERGRTVLLALDDDGTASIPGALPVRVGNLRSDWAGTPGVSSLLLGTGTRVETDDGAIDLGFSAAEIL